MGFVNAAVEHPHAADDPGQQPDCRAGVVVVVPQPAGAVLLIGADAAAAKFRDMQRCGNDWYSVMVVIGGDRWYSVVLGGTRWYSVVLGGTQ
jgi:hypothetical protein